MDQLLETMLTIAQRERVVELEAETKRVASQVGTVVFVNLDGSFSRSKGGPIPVHIPIVNEDPLEHSCMFANMDL